MLRQRTSLCVALAAFAAGCASGGGGSPTIDLSVAALTDVNPTSATADAAVHPDDYAGMVSAWYFGHST